jgi:hypothetical protein
MRTAEAVVQEFEDAAWHIAEVPPDEPCWDEERRATVVMLIERGSRIAERLAGPAPNGAGSIRWSESDSAVVLSRAFGRMHQRLVVAIRQAGTRLDDDAFGTELAGTSALPQPKRRTGRVDAVAPGPCAGRIASLSPNGTRPRAGKPLRSAGPAPRRRRNRPHERMSELRGETLEITNTGDNA